MRPLLRPADDWSARWSSLARAAGIAPEETLLLALSGGADSVLLLHWLAAARPAVDVKALHVDHGLRGEESASDARFCRELCQALGVPLAVARAELDGLTLASPGLEARARAERYRLLSEEARRQGGRTVLTGHHSDDALETLLERWIRGTELAGLRGPRGELHWHGTLEDGPAGAAPTVRVVRPLLALRREEVRALLAARGLAWREDSSNADPRFTRSRVRHALLPLVRAEGGAEAVDELRAFGRAVEELEQGFARATAHLSWQPAPFAALSRGPRERQLGGVLERGALMELARPLARRVLWRLLSEGTGRAPSRGVLERVLDDLGRGRGARHALGAGWTLLLRTRELALVAPRRAASEPAPLVLQLMLPFPSQAPAAPRRAGMALSVPGIVTLQDGRRISAELSAAAPGEPVRREKSEVELDGEDLPAALEVRWPTPGDRFRALGAPGSKPLTRFLADRGIPREERAHVPVVFAGGEIVWVAGVEPCERRRVQAHTRRRLRLALHA